MGGDQADTACKEDAVGYSTVRSIEKALRVVRLFERKRFVTAKDVAEELEIDRRNAQNWLMGACVVLPIYVVNEDRRKRSEFMVYTLAREDGDGQDRD